MITQPFNFAARLSRPSASLDVVPYVNLALLFLFLGVLSSRFVTSPGEHIGFPTTPDAAVDYVPTSRVLTVSEIDGHEMLTFDGRVLNLKTFELALAAHPAEPGEVLLLRIHRDVRAQLQVSLLEMARRAGFASIQIATEPERTKGKQFR